MQFEIEGKELKKYNKWYKKHSKKCKIKKKTAIGGTLTYSFTPTGIGCAVVVACACGKKIDVTDWESW